MAEYFLGIKVFLASPEGLKDEREHFRQIIWKFNENYAFDINHVFIPVMVEQMTGGDGQAQGRINKTIEDCDYCITMFCDNLGSPPEEDSPEGSVSVTDGERIKAVRLKAAGKLKETVIFFKKIPERQLIDKGPALERMLTYIDERKKDSHYITFDGKEQFEYEISRHLTKWLLKFRPIGDKEEKPDTVRDYEDPDKE
jgi:hypothetical protein